MMTKPEFDRHVRLMAFIDWLFKHVTPIFCALALLCIFATTLWRK